MDDIIKIITQAVADAGYARGQGSHRDEVTINLTIEQCLAISEIADEGYNAIVCGQQNMNAADDLAALGDAFKGEE